VSYRAHGRHLGGRSAVSRPGSRGVHGAATAQPREVCALRRRLNAACVVAVVAYAAMVVVATGFASYKLKSLGYHTRDYAFYRQFHARVFDPRMKPSYALNPQGSNVFRYAGIDGADAEGSAGLHRTMHLEPIKYVEAAVCRLFGQTALFAFVAALFFLPVLYAGFLALRAPRGDSLFFMIFALAYCALPSALGSATFDLRPYALLLPFLSLSLLALLFSRSAWEVFGFFNLLFASREEAILLGLGIVIIAFVLDREESGGARRRWGWSLLVNWAVWLAVTVLYLRWIGYPTTFLRDLGLVWAKLTGGQGTLASTVVTVAAGVLAWLVWRKLPSVVRILVVLAALFALASLPPWLRYRSGPLGEAAAVVAYHPRYAIVSGILLLAIVVVWRAVRPGRGRRWLSGALAVAAAVCAGLSFAPYELAAARQFASFVDRAPVAAPVFALRRSISPYDSTVVCDLECYEALCDIDRAYVYERLPYWMVPGEDRYFPANVAALTELVAERADYIAVGTEGARDLLPLVQATVGFDTLSASSAYTVLAVDRDASGGGSEPARAAHGNTGSAADSGDAMDGDRGSAADSGDAMGGDRGSGADSGEVTNDAGS
jgi:hypothetical protein